MQKFLGTAFAAALIATSTLPAAAARQVHHHRHQVREAYPAASAPFRNSNNAISAPYGYAAPQLPSYYSGGYSAPAGQ
jgi:hypothetical protein